VCAGSDVDYLDLDDVVFLHIVNWCKLFYYILWEASQSIVALQSIVPPGSLTVVVRFSEDP
jgi:hypothetical protein